MSDAESVVDAGTLANCSAFERDILWVLSNDGEQKGVTSASRWRSTTRNRSTTASSTRNLDDLVDAGFVEKGKIDGRTNSYALTETGRRTLTQRQKWQNGSDADAGVGDSE